MRRNGGRPVGSAPGAVRGGRRPPRRRPDAARPSAVAMAALTARAARRRRGGVRALFVAAAPPPRPPPLLLAARVCGRRAPPPALPSPWKTPSFRAALYPEHTRPVLVDGAAGLAAAAQALAPCTLLGVDTETKPRFRKGEPPERPSLLQIAGMPAGGAPAAGGGAAVVAVPRTVYVFDLPALVPAHADALSRALEPLLAGPGSLLLGVGIAADLRALARHYGGAVAALRGPARGVLDLSAVVGDRRRRGLRALAADYAGLALSKRQSRSDWSRRPLRPAQLQYAANDARAALAVYRAAGPDVFTGGVAELDLGVVDVWACRVCGRRFDSRRAMRTSCVDTCGMLPSEEKSLSFRTTVRLWEQHQRRRQRQ